MFPNAEICRHESYCEFVKRWKTSMNQAYRLANEHIKKAASYNKQKYDGKIKGG